MSLLRSLDAAAQPLEAAVTNDPDVAGREPEIRRNSVRGPVVVERHDEDGALALRQRREAVAAAARCRAGPAPPRPAA